MAGSDGIRYILQQCEELFRILKVGFRYTSLMPDNEIAQNFMLRAILLFISLFLNRYSNYSRICCRFASRTAVNSFSIWLR